MVAETAAGDHLFMGKPAASTAKKFHKAVLKEWELLKGNLPSSIWMQAYESRQVTEHELALNPKPLILNPGLPLSRHTLAVLFFTYHSPRPHKELLTGKESIVVSLLHSTVPAQVLGSLFLAFTACALPALLHCTAGVKNACINAGLLT